MDRDTRNAIERAAQRAREDLEGDFYAQLEGTFDVHASGEIAQSSGSHLKGEQQFRRDKIVAAIEHKRASGMTPAAAVADFVRDAAYTTLNRFVALKLLETRDLVQECITKGEQSSGFREFCGMAPGVALLPDSAGYRLYLESVFDELSTEVKVLFDRRDAASLFWPKRSTFESMLEVLNRGELSGVWCEDETIGWVYQYFNSDAERTQMRKESLAPRNSRELAVRNQFFTPRYVVQFLTDNTLGRIWYEMMQGETKLADLDYFVNRPNETFLADGVEGFQSEEDGDELSQDELLRQTVYVPFRAKQDPRDLHILDPACGSGHFLLYAFELLVSIYEEAWTDGEAEAFTENGRQLRADYESVDELRRAMPELILRHNLYGVDIDPRAAQIAAMALWMRAQRAYSQLGLSRAERPPITRTNIVVAEPMPGDPHLVGEFAASLKPAVLSDLFKQMVEEMKLAGELGSLLKIEESIETAVKKASEVSQQRSLFADGVETQDFWDTADDKIVDALGNFAESAAGSAGIRRKLFAGDAAQGVALIELMRKRFDVVLMNPPFGDATDNASAVARELYPTWGGNLACAFVSRARALASHQGLTGAILDSSTSIRSTYASFRREEYLSNGMLSFMASLGWGVLDAYVETTAIVRNDSSLAAAPILAIDVAQLPLDERAARLSASLRSLSSQDMRAMALSDVLKLPNVAIDLSWPEFLLRAFRVGQTLSEAGLASYQGHALEAARHYRLYWELSPEADLTGSQDWAFAFKGGEYSPGYLSETWVALVGPGYTLVPPKSSNVLRNRAHHFRGGVGYGKRGPFVDAQPLRNSSFFTHEGMAFVAGDANTRWFLLALINSDFFNFGINKYCGQHKQSGYVNLFPVPVRTTESDERVAALMFEIVALRAKWSQSVETDYFFVGPELLRRKPISDLPDSLKMVERDHDRDLQQLSRLWREVNGEINRLYGLSHEDSRVVEDYCSARPPIYLRSWADPRSRNIESTVLLEGLSFFVGCAFGRFDHQATPDKLMKISTQACRLAGRACYPAMRLNQRRPSFATTQGTR